MTREDAVDLEKVLMEEIVKRRKLGGYSPDAPGILMLAEVSLHIVQHIKNSLPRKK